jgi:hypothetical protein
MSRHDEAAPARRSIAVTVILLALSLAHLAYVPLAELRQMPILPPALALGVVLGAGYAYAARLASKGEGFHVAVNLIIGEDVGVLAAGMILGYPWGEYLLPGALPILLLQFALTFPEIWRRQELGRPIVAPARLAWFVLASAAAFAAYLALEPQGLWSATPPLP